MPIIMVKMRSIRIVWIGIDLMVSAMNYDSVIGSIMRVWIAWSIDHGDEDEINHNDIVDCIRHDRKIGQS